MPIIEVEDFVTAWNKYETPQDVADHFGVSYHVVTSRAYNLRKKGYDVPLKLRTDKAYFQAIGAKGGKIGRTGGFYANRELAREAGKIGGRVSRRKKKDEA